MAQQYKGAPIPLHKSLATGASLKEAVKKATAPAGQKDKSGNSDK